MERSGRTAAVLLCVVLVGTQALTATATATAPVLHASDDFRVTVDGEVSFVYLAAVEAAQGNGIVNASFVYVTVPAGGGHASVEVTMLSADINSTHPVRSAALRPRGSPAVALHGDGTTVSFSVSSPGHHVLEVDGTYTVVRAVLTSADQCSSQPCVLTRSRTYSVARCRNQRSVVRATVLNLQHSRNQ